VYHDDTCNRRFDPAWDRWLQNINVSLIFPNGYVETVATSSGGTAHFGALTLRRGETFELEAAFPPGTSLCYNSYYKFKLDFSDFEPVGYVGVSFRTD
jgi:hypothetical protein